MARKGKNSRAARKARQRADRERRTMLVKSAADSAAVFEELLPPLKGTAMGPNHRVSGQVAYRPPCHDHTKPVLTKNGLVVVGGPRTKIRYGFGSDMLLSCCGSAYAPPAIMTVNAGAAAALPGLRTISSLPCISIDWDDGSTPDLDVSHWEDLAQRLSEWTGTLGVFCEGGHGRTGTALVILAHFLDLIPEDAACPVEWLRERYCEDAVETREQINYIEHMTGRTVLAEGSYELLYGSYGKTTTSTPAAAHFDGRPWADNHNWSECSYPGCAIKCSGIYTNSNGDPCCYSHSFIALPPSEKKVIPLPAPSPKPDAPRADAARPILTRRYVVNDAGDVVATVSADDYPLRDGIAHDAPMELCPQCQRPAESVDIDMVGCCPRCFFSKPVAAADPEPLTGDDTAQDWLGAPLNDPDRPWWKWGKA